jgi:hypothetical protein
MPSIPQHSKMKLHTLIPHFHLESLALIPRYTRHCASASKATLGKYL